MTEAQKDALKWLQDHGGDAVRQGRSRQQVLAQGEVAPFAWKTWRSLIDSGRVEKYGVWRMRLVQAGGAR